MNKLILSPTAIKEFAEIKNYIQKELRNSAAAKRIISKIKKDLRVLEYYPETGSSVRAITGEDTDIRILVCDKYIALYRIFVDHIYAARITIARQDFLRVLFGRSFEWFCCVSRSETQFLRLMLSKKAVVSKRAGYRLL